MEVTLKRNGWHRRLQEYVFNSPPRYPNLCPYFWLTNFCILVTFIVPIVPLIKTFRWITIKIGVGFTILLSKIDEKICQPIYDNIVKNLPSGDIVDGWLEAYGWDIMQDMSEEEQKIFSERYSYLHSSTSYGAYSARHKRVERFARWKDITPDWEKKIAEFKEKQKLYFIELEKQRIEAVKKQEAERAAKQELERKNAATIAAKEAKRQRRFTAIVKYTKMLTPIVLGAIALFALYWICRFGYWAYTKINWLAVGKAIAIITVAAIILFLAYGIIYLLVMLIKKCKLSAIEIPGLKYLVWPFVQLWKGIVWLAIKIAKFFMNYIAPFFIGIGSGLQFFGQYLKTTKGNYCPHINWEEDEPAKI